MLKFLIFFSIIVLICFLFTKNRKTFFKKIRSDFSNLSKQEFGGYYVLPMVAVFFLLGALGRIYIIATPLTKLKAYKGQVVSISQGVESNYRSTSRPLYITLFKYDLDYETINRTRNIPQFIKEFRLGDQFDSEFKKIEEKLKTSDTATVYYRSWFQTLLGMGRENDIFQIEKGNQILLDYSKIKDYHGGQLVLFFLAAALTGAGYWLFKNARKNKMPNEAVTQPDI